MLLTEPTKAFRVMVTTETAGLLRFGVLFASETDAQSEAEALTASGRPSYVEPTHCISFGDAGNVLEFDPAGRNTFGKPAAYRRAK